MEAKETQASGGSEDTNAPAPDMNEVIVTSLTSQLKGYNVILSYTVLLDVMKHSKDIRILVGRTDK
jgi:hypothetical protein